MEEKTIIKGELKNPIILCIILPIIAVIATILFDLSASKRLSRIYGINGGKPDYAYGFGFGNGVNYVLYPLIIVLIILGIVIYKRLSKVQITVTDKRVYGSNAFGKRVDLPFDSISAVGTSIFSGLSVTTASGAIRFTMLKNRDEIHEAISKLLVDRQNKPVSTTTIKQEIPQSNADELKKYKELLESGVITQEEFDAKKKQLLGL
ncbi:MAG: SHOCT domain-containing protein [Clostridia bacterium]|nr:SHOCT domain-containing protein [Clostridia bacterium]